jgi:hypothetical protein
MKNSFEALLYIEDKVGISENFKAGLAKMAKAKFTHLNKKTFI